MLEKWIGELALDGIEYRREQLDRDVATIREQMEPLDKPNVATPVKVKVPAAPKKKRRNLSEAARQRIAQAQVARWQKHRAAKAS